MAPEINNLAALLRVSRTCDGVIQKPKASDLNIAHWNVNRLLNKLDERESYIDCYPGILHILIIAETWLIPITAPLANLNGYRAEHNIRETRRGGGISMFVHESLCQNSHLDVRISQVTNDLNHS